MGLTSNWEDFQLRFEFGIRINLSDHMPVIVTFKLN